MKRDLPPVIFGSVCSGIEAASEAVHPLGWEAAWLAEIEPHPCKVLHHHYDSGRPLHMPSPDDDGLSEEDRDARRAAIKSVSWLPEVVAGPRNLGDFTKIADMVRSRQVAAPDVLIGGTPCQAFSIAGLRIGLSDARGALTLSFVKLANEIDTTRSILGKPPAIIWWENVPGVLSSKDNAFGCFLAALAGEDDELVAPGGKWPNAGCVYGPQRAVAWRVLDAQYFGVAQRRRRVFVVASAREGFDPAEVLFEFDGVRRDSAPSREARESTTHPVAPCLTSSGRGVERGGDTRGQDPVVAVSWPAQIAPTLNAAFGSKLGLENQHIRGGQDYSSLRLARCLTTKTRIDAETETLIPTIGGVFVDAPIAFDNRQDCVSSTAVFGALGSSSPQAQAVAFSCKDHGGDATLEMAPTMRAMGHARSHANSGGQLAVCITGEITHTLKAEGFDASEDGTGRGQPIVAALKGGQGSKAGGIGWSEHVAPTLSACPSGTQLSPTLLSGMAVRRLTPIECERLQAFPDNYTLVPTKKISKARAEKLLADGEPAVLIGDQWWEQSADGPRYKALGNSMCVKNMAWIGRRIDAQLRALEAA